MLNQGSGRQIKDGSVTDADIASNAGIQASKIDTTDADNLVSKITGVGVTVSNNGVGDVTLTVGDGSSTSSALTMWQTFEKRSTSSANTKNIGDGKVLIVPMNVLYTVNGVTKVTFDRSQSGAGLSGPTEIEIGVYNADLELIARATLNQSTSAGTMSMTFDVPFDLTPGPWFFAFYIFLTDGASNRGTFSFSNTSMNFTYPYHGTINAGGTVGQRCPATLTLGSITLTTALSLPYAIFSVV